MSLNRLKAHFIDVVLPTWLHAAFDEDNGQFVEALELDGVAETTGVVRVRTAARQIYVYAHAHAVGVAPGGGLEKAERAFEALHRLAWIDGENGGYAATINMRTNEIVDRRRDLYDHACVLLALAWLSKATGRQIYRRRLDEMMTAVDTTLAAPHGGWAEDEKGTLPRRQNPHMHFFEACLALWETGHGERHAARAGELLMLFLSRLYDNETGVLREFFGPAWELDPRFRSERLEPGHMAEWVWLLRRYEKFSGRNLAREQQQLLATALKGRAGGSVFLVDEMDADGQPLSKSRRLWPQAELIKAFLAIAETQPQAGLRTQAEQLTDGLFETYLAETPRGTWRDAFDLDGNRISRTIPGSSLYHMWTAVAELL